MKFDFTTNLKGAEVAIHFDFDNYLPCIMNSTLNDNFSIHRMVPSGNHSFFFSVNGKYTIN
jgi:hypothetical protein